MSEDYVLELEHIRKEYPGVIALADVTLQLRRGEVLGLIGENGAGKSTLIKCCSGAVVPTSGKIKINGKEFDRMTPQLAAENGIAIIYQEFNNVKELSAAENLFLGRPIRKGVMIDKKAMEQKAKEAFDQLHIKINPKELVKNLTVGYQQMIEIAKAVQQNAQVLIMDEPSAPLTTNEVKSMFEVVELLRKKGVSIIYISHRLEEIFYLSDRIEVIRDGEYVDTLITKEANVDQLISLMVGREMTQKFPPRPDCIDKSKVVLELKDVCGNGDRNMSLKIHAGEVLGLGGLVGAGRTELAQVIFGSKPKESGQILLNGKEINPQSPREAIDLGIALVPEDRKLQGILTNLSVEGNINISLLDQNSNGLGVIDSRKESAQAEESIRKFQIKTPDKNKLIVELSGGNQQKCIVARGIATNPKVLILDEPTKGIDIGAKSEFYEMICAFAKQGLGVILISSELPEVIGLSDRIIVMRSMQISGEVMAKDAIEDKLLSLGMIGE